MAKYTVTIPYVVHVTVTDIEAESEDEAIDIAFDEGCVSGYCGNGGDDKLIGVDGENVSIECCEDCLDGINPFSIMVDIDDA